MSYFALKMSYFILKMSYLTPYLRPKNVLLRPKNVCLYLLYKKNSIKFIVPKNFVAVWNKSNLLV